MKLTEITPLDDNSVPRALDSDRLTSLLVWVTFFLVAGLAALVTDLWLWPGSDGPVAQAVELTVLPPTMAPTVTAQPTAAPTVVTIEPTTLPTIEAPSPTPATPPPCVPPNDWSIHVVQPGNTLYSLAQRYGTDVETLMRVNCLNTHTIFIDQRLYVPGLAPSPVPPTPAATASPLPLPTSTPRPGASATPVVEIPWNATPVVTPVLSPTPRSPFQLNVPDHLINIVLLGSDKRPQGGTWRTDSMIIVSVDTQANVVRLLSLPRDLWVYIPGHGNNRINTADLWGELDQKGTGPEWVKRTIHYNLGIPIHYYVRVDFQGFMKIVDTVGGIDVDVDCPLPDINLSAGIHHMNGQQALRYSRSRKSTSDFDRGRRQRKVLMALWEQGLTLDIIPKVPELWRTMADTFQTDLPLDQVITLAYVGVHLEPQRIISKAIGRSHVQSWLTPEGAAVLLPREDKIRAMLENLYTPVDVARLDALGKVRIRVLDGSPRNEVDKLAASTLRWEGFKVVGTGEADRQDYAQTSILIYTGDRAAAEGVAQALNVSPAGIQDFTGLKEQPDPAKPVDIQIILGRDYNPCQQ
jgi:LCP family protein required for cell wall assembly